MNTIELIVAASSIIVALTIAFIAYVLLKPRKEQTEAKEQVTIEASIEAYDETAKLKARIEFLEAEIEKFATICDGLTAANKKCLDEFEAYVRLTQGEQEKPVKHLSEVNAIDWSKPVAFPVGYEIPIGIECVTLNEDIWGGFITPIGTKIKVLGHYGKVNSSPYFERMDGVHREKNIDQEESGYCDGCLNSDELAPLNPTDHPNHPEFKNK